MVLISGTNINMYDQTVDMFNSAESSIAPQSNSLVGQTAPIDTGEVQQVTLWMDYTIKSHVITGPFKTLYESIRVNEFRPKQGVNYHPKLYVGKGWIIAKEHTEWIKDLLERHCIPYDIKPFDTMIRQNAKRKKVVPVPLSCVN